MSLDPTDPNETICLRKKTPNLEHPKLDEQKFDAMVLVG